MLHLLPVRYLLAAYAAVFGAAVLVASQAGWLGNDALRDAGSIVRWSSSVAFATIVLFCAAWRWIPPLQRVIFPYLGGQWEGVLEFDGPAGPGRRAVTLEVIHTPLGLKMMLDSEESSSRTLIVQADRDPDFGQFRLYYVYLNQRKEGQRGAGDTYRGLAIMRVVDGTRPRLTGDYFTDTHRRGTLQLTQTAATPAWKIWR